MSFEELKIQYPGTVAEVSIGATRSEGGTRDRVVKIGGERSLYLHNFDCVNPNRPTISFNVFDIPIPLPKPIKENFLEVLDDPVAWAKKCVEKFDAEVITIHLISTDPKGRDTSPEQAAKTVENILQAIKVPLIIGGSGNQSKDSRVLSKVGEVAEGERCLLSYATIETYKPIVKAALDYGHDVLARTSLDLLQAKKLNQLLQDEGLPKERIIMDPETVALGYGLEYTYTMFERIRLSALHGDEDLQMPILASVTNAWTAREAWEKNPSWGPAEYRGPLWEAVTGISAVIAGADILLMMHPKAVKLVDKFIKLTQK
jgi:acetyl-CoA decarbonylase/synthase complex subunit delta